MICMICGIYVVFISGVLYDTDLSHMFAWVGSV